MYYCWKCGKLVKNQKAEHCDFCGAKKDNSKVYGKMEQEKLCMEIYKERWRFLLVLAALVLLAEIMTA